MPATRPFTVLRDQMVCPRPTRAELAARAPIELTARDEELLLHVHRFGFLTAELIERALFPDDGRGRRTRSSPCYERLRQLWLWRYLERVELPVARVLGGRRAYLHALGPRGVAHVEAALGPGRPVRRRRLDRLDDRFLAHDLKVAALWAGLRAVVRGSRLGALRWEGERELRARGWSVEDPRRRRRVPVVPDAYAELAYPDGSVECVLVEVDMATLPLARFRAKVAAFERFRDEGGFARQTGYEHFEVWVLAPSPARLEHLRRAARDVVRPERRAAYLLAPFDALRPDALAGAAWRDLDGVGRSALDDGAFPEPDPPGDVEGPSPGASPPRLEDRRRAALAGDDVLPASDGRGAET